MGTSISPNDTDFNQTLTKTTSAAVAQAVLSSGLWEINDEFTPCLSNSLLGYLRKLLIPLPLRQRDGQRER